MTLVFTDLGLRLKDPIPPTLTPETARPEHMGFLGLYRQPTGLSFSMRP